MSCCCFSCLSLSRFISSRIFILQVYSALCSFSLPWRSSFLAPNLEALISAYSYALYCSTWPSIILMVLSLRASLSLRRSRLRIFSFCLSHLLCSRKESINSMSYLFRLSFLNSISILCIYFSRDLPLLRYVSWIFWNLCKMAVSWRSVRSLHWQGAFMWRRSISIPFSSFIIESAL